MGARGASRPPHLRSVRCGDAALALRRARARCVASSAVASGFALALGASGAFLASGFALAVTAGLVLSVVLLGRSRVKGLSARLHLAAGLVALVVAVVAVGLAAEADGVSRSVPDATDAIALTFDDGPDPRYTPAILEILGRHGAKATFFVIGEHAEKYPDIVARIVAEGHEVAHHTFSHPHVDRIGPAELAGEMDRTIAVLGAQNVTPSWYRPPRKRLTRAQEQAASSRGMGIAMWTRCLERDRFATAVEAAETLASEARSGDIVLAHDGLHDRSMTIEALPLFLAAMEEQGLRVVTLSDLHGREYAGMQSRHGRP